MAKSIGIHFVLYVSFFTFGGCNPISESENKVSELRVSLINIDGLTFGHQRAKSAEDKVHFETIIGDSEDKKYFTLGDKTKAIVCCLVDSERFKETIKPVLEDERSGDIKNDLAAETIKPVLVDGWSRWMDDIKNDLAAENLELFYLTIDGPSRADDQKHVLRFIKSMVKTSEKLIIYMIKDDRSKMGCFADYKKGSEKRLDYLKKFLHFSKFEI